MKKIMTVALIVVLLFSSSIPVVAKNEECWASGCHGSKKSGGNYCVDHTCNQRGCYKKVSSTDKLHCVKHKAPRAEVKAAYSYSKKSSVYKKSTTKKSTTQKSTKKSSWQSYDDGYNDVYEDDDYDWDRYWTDDDYASGVDDAMDDMDW